MRSTAQKTTQIVANIKILSHKIPLDKNKVIRLIVYVYLNKLKITIFK